MLAAADPPAQLVQLRDAVALGVLDEHHRRVRDVDPDLDHGRGDEHVGAAGGERRHRLLLLARAHLAVQQHDAEVRAARSSREPLELGGRGARLERLGLLDERADDERLAAGAQLLADPLVGARALALGRRDVRLDRPAPRGQLAQHGDVEVAVGGQRERARDRRRGHVQHVRREAVRRLAVERAALVDAEAVLLVDDRDGEAVELDGGLDQRVRADEQLAARRWRACRAGRRGGRRRVEPVSSAACTQLARHQRLQRGEVLLGERLGRRHQRRLRAVLDRAQHRVERDDGLARADLAHQQPLHRPAGREVARRSRPSRAAWSPVGVNGSDSASQRAVSVGGVRERLGARRLAPPRAPAQQRELEQQQLLEGEPHAGRPPGRRSAPRASAAGAVGPAPGGAQPRGQRLDDVGAARRGARARARRSASRRAPRSPGRWRRRPPAPDLLVGLGVELDPEAVAALVLALQHQPRAGAVLALEPRLVEERRLHDPGLRRRPSPRRAAACRAGAPGAT